MNVNFKKILLIVLDGFGAASSSPGNAVTRAGMKVFDYFVNNFPSLTLQAAGPNVGLPWGEPGNSEVGHMCMGAGRIVLQDLPRIDKSITTGEFYKNPAFTDAVKNVSEKGSSLHLIGLIGSGGVHASQLHLYSLMTLAASEGLEKVYIHCITDGRDSRPDVGRDFIKDLEKKIIELGTGRIATVSGRFYAMDRAKHWDLTEKAYQAMTSGTGEVAESALAAVERYYEQSIFDETIPPTVISPTGEQPVTVQPGDSVIFFNFRTDRAIQLTQAFCDPTNLGFSQPYQKIPDLYIATMTVYEENLPVAVAFPKLPVPNVLTEVLANSGKSQYHVSEVEKFPHVTYFFSNGLEKPHAGEVWDKVSSNSSYKELYLNVPQMSANELTAKLLGKLDEPFDFYLVNYANPDMVGHTGSLEATIKALQTVDNCLGQLAEHALNAKDTLILITADHGNAEEIHEASTGRVKKAHSTNPVPFILIGDGLRLKEPRKSGYLYLATQVPDGLLSDVAPTILDFFQIPIPQDMTGVSLAKNFLRQI